MSPSVLDLVYRVETEVSALTDPRYSRAEKAALPSKVDLAQRSSFTLLLRMHAHHAPMTPSSGHCIFCDLIRGAAEVSICL